ncbi:MAG: hypothetical protein WC055_00660 [Melioribacteraceae bacterium]
MNRPRNENETYEEYQMNLAMDEFKLSNYLKGKVVWTSSTKGTYIDKTKAFAKLAKGTRRVNQ